MVAGVQCVHAQLCTPLHKITAKQRTAWMKEAEEFMVLMPVPFIGTELMGSKPAHVIDCHDYMCKGKPIRLAVGHNPKSHDPLVKGRALRSSS
jgi:hypothetical protein